MVARLRSFTSAVIPSKMASTKKSSADVNAKRQRTRTKRPRSKSFVSGWPRARPFAILTLARSSVVRRSKLLRYEKTCIIKFVLTCVDSYLSDTILFFEDDETRDHP